MIEKANNFRSQSALNHLRIKVTSMMMTLIQSINGIILIITHTDTVSHWRLK